MPAFDPLRLLPRPRRMDLSERTRVLPPRSPRCTIDAGLPPEGYRLIIEPTGEIDISSADAAGLFYARATLDQLGRCSTGESLPVGTIEDWPDLPVRGVMLDVSRCKVPTLDTLFFLVERLASWKVNHLQLYMEHTFAYPGHRQVWEHADPYTPDDLTRLGAHCREYHIELVPNQNTLGHMERWLLHPRYTDLGISRGVVTSPLGLPIPASTLDPSRADAFALVRELIGTLASAIPSSRFHVGLDEPWDLPPQRSPEWAQWAQQLSRSSELADREMLVWGDMLTTHPELIDRLPESTTVCEWGYDAGHPFTTRAEPISEKGIPVWLCAGTSSWLSMVGRITNAVDNCREAALAAPVTGATGMLVTDWGDFGHHQGWAVSEPGIAAAAAFSWCAETNRHLDVQAIGDLLDLHSFGDSTGSVGASLAALGDLYQRVPLAAPNMSSLTLHLYLPQLAVGSGFTTGLTPDNLEEMDEVIDTSLQRLNLARPGTGNGKRAAAELATGARLVKLACRDARGRLAGDGKLASIPAMERSVLAGDLEAIIESYRVDWLARDRPGGLDESCEWLEHLRHCYLTGATDHDWAGPLVAQVRARDAATTGR